MRVKSNDSTWVKEAYSSALKSLTHLRRKVPKTLTIRHSQIFAPFEDPIIFMLSSIQKADAAAGIFAFASSLLMCPCSCLIKNFCLVQHHLLSPFLSSPETAVQQRGARHIHQDMLGSWMNEVALAPNSKIL